MIEHQSIIHFIFVNATIIMVLTASSINYKRRFLSFPGLKKTLEEQKGRLKAELNVAQVKVSLHSLDDCTTDTTGCLLYTVQ